MSIPPKGLASFAELYKKEFAEDLTPEDLDRKARLLRNLYMAIYESPLEVAKQQLIAEQDSHDES